MNQRLLGLFLLMTLIRPAVAQGQTSLTEDEIADAIALGRSGTVPILKVTRFVSDYEVQIAGPVARIAAAANDAIRRYRPFDSTNVKNDMSARVFTITVHRSSNGERTMAEHVVLQPKGAKGLDGAIQPLVPGDHLTRIAGLFEWRFDRLPDGDFQVVVVKGDRPQLFAVSSKDRAKIR